MNLRPPRNRNLQPRRSPQNEHALRKIAMLLMELSIEVSAEVTSRLTPQELRGLAEAMAELEMIDVRGASEAFRERQSMKANGEVLAKLGSVYAWHFVYEALRSEPARQRIAYSGDMQTIPELFQPGVVKIPRLVDGL